MDNTKEKPDSEAVSIWKSIRLACRFATAQRWLNVPIKIHRSYEEFEFASVKLEYSLQIVINPISEVFLMLGTC